MEVLFLIALVLIFGVVVFLGESMGFQIAVPVGLLLATILTILFVYWIKREKREDATNARRAAEWEEEKKEKEYILAQQWDLRHWFGVTDFSQIQDPSYQKEIVRIVNLNAVRLAAACLRQEEARMHENPVRQIDLDNKVHNLKNDWAESRKLALEVCPELESELPHFSEFEPLKSYREENFSKKRAKEA